MMVHSLGPCKALRKKQKPMCVCVCVLTAQQVSSLSRSPSVNRSRAVNTGPADGYDVKPWPNLISPVPALSSFTLSMFFFPRLCFSNPSPVSFFPLSDPPHYQHLTLSPDLSFTPFPTPRSSPPSLLRAFAPFLPLYSYIMSTAGSLSAPPCQCSLTWVPPLLNTLVSTVHLSFFLRTSIHFSV